MRPWHLGNTTVRSPFRLRDGLVALSTSSLQGNLRGQEQEIALRRLLGEHGIVELGDDDTYSVGRKWRSALNKLGFLYPEVPPASGIPQSEIGPIDMITPNGWRLIRADTVPAMQITPQQAALHYATGTVAWEDGSEPLVVLRGGINVASGRQSILSVSPIIALSGQAAANLFDVVPTVTKAKLLRRDRFTCAYCGEVHPERDFQVEHILPESRGGGYTWMNLVIADRWCNARKSNRTPQEASMPLLFVPYVPNRYEDFILAGRNIRADVHEWLAARLPKHSRLC